MTADAVAKQYKLLTPEERFRLILAASGRGDDAERERLVRASGRIHLTMPDYSPYANALQDISLMIFIELLAESAQFLWASALADQEDDRDAATRGEADPDMDDDEPETAELEFANERKLRLALAAGYVLRTKAEGWKQFCERWDNPPFLLWEDLPGFDRFQSALKLTDVMAFTAEGFLRWLNKVRPAAHLPITEVPVTAERTADDVERAFQIRIEWWSGRRKD
jgi:hypothetical protein